MKKLERASTLFRGSIDPELIALSPRRSILRPGSAWYLTLVYLALCYSHALTQPAKLFILLFQIEDLTGEGGFANRTIVRSTIGGIEPELCRTGMIAFHAMTIADLNHATTLIAC